MRAPLHPETAIRIIKSLVRLVGHNSGAKGFWVAILLLTSVTIAQASHFRYGNVSWRYVDGNTVEFKISQSWRYTAFYAEVGQVVNPGDFMFGDGTFGPIKLNVTAVNKTDDWMYGEAIITKTYNTTGTYIANFTGCCRVSELKNNPEGQWNLQTTVTIGNGNSAPVTTLPAMVHLPEHLHHASFEMPASDPDGDALTYTLATSAEMGGGHNPEGLTVDAASGHVHFNTETKHAGEIYNAAITITDSRGAKVTSDFIIKITEQSTAPVFDYSITPENGIVYHVAPDKELKFNIKAHDTDPDDVVTLIATGLPVTSTINPALPLTANPVQSAFAWKPTVNDVGTYVISFTAQDKKSVQTSTSVTIQVSYKARFDVPPSPDANSYTFTTPGQAINLTLQASSPVASEKLTITELTGLPGSAPKLPPAAANPVQMQLTWTPETKNWGTHRVTAKVRDSRNEEISHSFNLVVNTPPVFTSAPTEYPLAAGYTYRYEITAQDDDLPYGDQLEILAEGIPDWLTLEDDGKGNAILTGTPTINNVGEYTIKLLAEDKWHHNGGLAVQELYLKVNDASCGDNNEKVLICHNGQTICVPANMVQEHLDHGCYLGTCDPLIPSDVIVEDTKLIAYPNPLSHTTTLEFMLPAAGKYTLDLINSNGQKLSTWQQGQGNLGQYYNLQVPTADLKPGIYFVRLITEVQVQHVKVVKQ